MPPGGCRTSPGNFPFRLDSTALARWGQSCVMDSHVPHQALRDSSSPQQWLLTTGKPQCPAPGPWLSADSARKGVMSHYPPHPTVRLKLALSSTSCIPPKNPTPACHTGTPDPPISLAS